MFQTTVLILGWIVVHNTLSVLINIALKTIFVGGFVVIIHPQSQKYLRETLWESIQKYYPQFKKQIKETSEARGIEDFVENMRKLLK